jgi:hypothetical protein
MLRQLHAPARLLVPAILLAAFSDGHAVRAETRITGEPDAVRIEARDAPVDEVLEALGESFGLQYQSTASLSRRVTGTYEGSVQRVVRRLLEGYDFIMKTGPGTIEVKVYGTVKPGEAQLAPKVTQTAKPAQVTKTTRAARRARRGY